MPTVTKLCVYKLATGAACSKDTFSGTKTLLHIDWVAATQWRLATQLLLQWMQGVVVAGAEILGALTRLNWAYCTTLIRLKCSWHWVLLRDRIKNFKLTAHLKKKNIFKFLAQTFYKIFVFPNCTAFLKVLETLHISLPPQILLLSIFFILFHFAIFVKSLIISSVYLLFLTLLQSSLVAPPKLALVARCNYKYRQRLIAHPPHHWRTMALLAACCCCKHSYADEHAFN